LLPRYKDSEIIVLLKHGRKESMANEHHSHTIEDKLAEHLARFGKWASLLSLFILLLVVASNLLLWVKLLISAILVAIATIGPAVSAIASGISTAISYYGRLRVLRGRERLDLRDEAMDQLTDQITNRLPDIPNALKSQVGCLARATPILFGASLIFCLLTYAPPPLRIFGLNKAIGESPAPTTLVVIPQTSPTPIIPTMTPSLSPTVQPSSSPSPTTTVHATPVSRPTATPIVSTPTPIPPPGNLVVLTPLIDTGTCSGSFSDAVFSITNNGGTFIYWQAHLPSEFQLLLNYPASGTLQPYQGDSQNDHFQGIATKDKITVNWGLTPNALSNIATINTTCDPIT
jgi:hypothetical protein